MTYNTIIEQDEERNNRKIRLWCYRIVAFLGLVAIILILLFKPCNCDCEKKEHQASSQQTVSSSYSESYSSEVAN